VATDAQMAPGPTHPEYWSKERLDQIYQWCQDTCDDFGTWQQTACHGDYRGVSLTLVRRLKSKPEWQELDADEATRGLDVAFELAGWEWDSVLPVVGVNQVEARDDFIATWRVRLALDPAGRDPLELAYDNARQAPVEWTPELTRLLGPPSVRFRTFVSLASCLQKQVGLSGFILLPQERIAAMLGVSQRQVSAWCGRLRTAGILIETERFVPMRTATKWRYSESSDL
jgi:hypothetical protein